MILLPQATHVDVYTSWGSGGRVSWSLEAGKLTEMAESMSTCGYVAHSDTPWSGGEKS